MLSSIARARTGISHAPRSSARRNAASASCTRMANALMTGVSTGCTVRGTSAGCELTMMFIVPCR